jgi:hypothetical protein
MTWIDPLITIRGIFDAHQGKAYPWRLHRALRVGMRTPHGDIEFRRAFGGMTKARVSSGCGRPHAAAEWAGGGQQTIH